MSDRPSTTEVWLQLSNATDDEKTIKISIFSPPRGEEGSRALFETIAKLDRYTVEDSRIACMAPFGGYTEVCAEVSTANPARYHHQACRVYRQPGRALMCEVVVIPGRGGPEVGVVCSGE